MVVVELEAEADDGEAQLGPHHTRGRHCERHRSQRRGRGLTCAGRGVVARKKNWSPRKFYTDDRGGVKHNINKEVRGGLEN